MASRRDFLKQGAGLCALGAVGAAPLAAAAPSSTGMSPPPDLFDAQLLDLDFWVKPRTLSVVRPASGERAKVLRNTIGAPVVLLVADTLRVTFTSEVNRAIFSVVVIVIALFVPGGVMGLIHRWRRKKRVEVNAAPEKN